MFSLLFSGVWPFSRDVNHRESLIFHTAPRGIALWLLQEAAADLSHESLARDDECMGASCAANALQLQGRGGNVTAEIYIYMCVLCNAMQCNVLYSMYVFYVCILCMYSMYVFYVCFLCMYSVYVFCVCILCMYSMYVFYVCFLCMYSMYVFCVCILCMYVGMMFVTCSYI